VFLVVVCVLWFNIIVWSVRNMASQFNIDLLDMIYLEFNLH